MQTSNELPRYKQLYEALRQQILEGLLLPGMRLPSSRLLAKQLKLSRNTVLAAIEQLCAEGYTSPRAKSGVYVLSTGPTNWDTSDAIRIHFKPTLSSRGKKIVEQSRLYPMRGAFAPGVPDLKQFPFEFWQRYVVRHTRNPKLNWLANSHQGGDSELRQTLVDYLRVARGIRCEAAQNFNYTWYAAQFAITG
jgi:GntR family transcriptional regulator/MocR family aminotransferase